VRNFCRAREALVRVEKPSRQKKRTIRYALDFRDGSVFMVQRTRAASLMAGMWELPELPGELSASPPEKTRAPCLTLRHSITVTDYTVQVVRQPAPRGASGKWVPASRASTLPLTGLARKILRKAEII
jgi:adenine-specific DNA glycosylase